MKRIFLALSILITLNGLSQIKQPDDKKLIAEKKRLKEKLNIGLNFGTSIIGYYNKGEISHGEYYDTFIGLFAYHPAYYKYSGKSTPVIGINAEAYGSKRLSMGLYFSMQQLYMDIDYWQKNELYGPMFYNNNATLTRLYIGGRLLYHYKNNQKVDLYSGIRFGWLHWGIRLEKDEPVLVESILSVKSILWKNRPAIGLIPFGCRIKVNKQIAVCPELGVGAPSFLSIGTTYSFYKKL